MEDDKSRMLLYLATRLIAAAASMSPPTSFNARDPFPLDTPEVGEDVTFSTPLHGGTIKLKITGIEHKEVVGGLRDAHKQWRRILRFASSA